MGNIDPDKLKWVRDDYRLSLKEPQYYPDRGVYKSADDIREKLAQMGLDLEDDATYELLEDGLTKAKFDQQEFVAKTYLVTTFHNNCKDTDWDRYDTPQNAKLQKVKSLVNYMRLFARDFDSNSLPFDVDPGHAREFYGLLNDFKNGKLQSYYKDTVVDAAVETFNSASVAWKEIKNDFDTVNSKRLEDVLGDIKSCSKLIEEMDFIRVNDFADKADINFSSYQAMHKEIAAAYARKEIENVFAQQQMDLSGLTYQNVLEALDDAGFDLNDPSTFDEIGTNKDELWEKYEKHIEDLKKDGDSSKMPQRIFKPRL